jgi:hypothetical protein
MLGDRAFATKGGLTACVCISVLIGMRNKNLGNSVFKMALNEAWSVYTIGTALIFVLSLPLKTDELAHP